MNVGFSGTRKGMSQAQKSQLRYLFTWLSAHLDEFHHGAAVGADIEAVDLLGKSSIASDVEIYGHPAGDDPLGRNRAIIAAVDILIAAPAEDKEQLRSGTWATVRYARQAKIPVIMLTRGVQ